MISKIFAFFSALAQVLSVIKSLIAFFMVQIEEKKDRDFGKKLKEALHESTETLDNTALHDLFSGRSSVRKQADPKV